MNAPRRAEVYSPFGLLVDLGAAVMAELGISVGQIAEQLSGRAGRYIAEEAARAAVVRGRQQLAARRLNRARFAPVADPPRSASPVAALPSPREIPDADRFELLLLWAERGPQRAGTLAAKARTLLDEIRTMQLEDEARRRRQRGRTQARRDLMASTGASTLTERRKYLAQVREWAKANGWPSPRLDRVPAKLIAAYQAATAERHDAA